MIEVEKTHTHKEREREREMEEESSNKKSISSILKKVERYLSMKRRNKSSTAKAAAAATTTRSKSWSSSRRKPAPIGCISVYVGEEKQRFVIKTEFINHPLFKILLEDAELEYGFNSDGPLLLPCHVDLFYKVLAELECGDDDDDFDSHSPCGCSPARRRFGRGEMYGLLTPLRSLKASRHHL